MTSSSLEVFLLSKFISSLDAGGFEVCLCDEEVEKMKFASILD